MFGKIAAFEFRHQLRQPVFWVVSALFFLLSLLSMVLDNVQIGSGGQIHRNAPFAVAETHLVLAIFYMFVTTAFVANVIVRDDETGFGPIVRTTRITKRDYLYGRFAGAFAAAVLSFIAVPLAIWLGSLAPWIDPQKLGPFHPQAYAFAFFVLALPSILFTACAFFALATVTRSMMWTYVGVVAFMVVWTIATIALGKPQYETIAAFVEPFGAAAFGSATKYWTASERNSLVPAIEGALLWNRLAVVALSAGFLALAYALFRFEGAKTGAARKAPPEAQASPPAASLGALPRPRYGPAAALAQMAARTRMDMGQVFKSPAFGVLLALGLFNAVGGLWFATEAGAYGGMIHPVTRVLIPTLNGTFVIIPVIIAVYYAGELVWRERERRTHEIIDATPVSDWAFVAPKTAAIALVLIATLLVSVAAAVAVQVFKGYFNIEPGKYLAWYLVPNAVELTFLAVLAVFIQALSPHKFVGWAVMIVYVIAVGPALNKLGLEHNLYHFGGGPQVPLSDMNGQGRFWVGAWWLRLYWGAFCVALLVLAKALWRRGTETRLRPRLARLPRRLAGPSGVVLALAAAVFAGAGVWIFVNTNVWNDYRTTRGDERWLADMERALIAYEDVPQPKVVEVRLDVAIHPSRARIDTRGAYVVENRTGEALRELHLLFDRDLEVKALSIQGARPKKTLARFNYRIFAFDTPMAPGERRTLSFITRREQRGFRNDGQDTRVVGNGTFVNNLELTPILGVSRALFLKDRSKRRDQNLTPEDLRPPKLGDPASLAVNYLRHDSDFVDADITVSTRADQTPIAPGDKVSETVKDGRRTARFVTEAPIMHFFSVQSARYAKTTERYKGVDLSVYYDPQHPWNIERMQRAMRLSLDYCQASFSSYQFRQLRFIEFPDYAQFAQSFAGTIPWSEGLGFIADYSDPEKIDLVTYVGAHEIAHQWWAHQIVGADQQGATALSETLAQYSALMVMKHLHGPDMIRKFLRFELDSYLRARGGEAVEELPLARVEDQPYIHYRKGSLVMYRLADEIGEDAVNRALRRLLARYAFKGAPYPTTLDLIAALRAEAPAGKQALITDLFEKITLYDVKTTGVAVKRRTDGRFDVALSVEARKLYADGAGVETAAPLAETMDVGLFSAMPGDKDFDARKVIVMARRPIRSGAQTLTFTTDEAPKYAGVDPYNKLIDRNSGDNVAKAD